MQSTENKRTERWMVRIFALTALLSATALLYQNCAPAPKDPPPAAFHTPEDNDRVAAFAVEQNGGADACRDAAAYLCEARVYSPDVEYGTSNSFECGQDGDRDTCVEVIRMNFNTKANIADCKDCSPAEIRERYVHDDFICMNRRVRAQGTLPVKSEGSSLEDALNNARARCLELAAQGE